MSTVSSPSASSASSNTVPLPSYRVSVFLLLLLGVLVRWSTSVWGYSGQGKPPMFGDYEAQRHWMEITSNLPVQEWYVQGEFNDLLYWGLDYPPITAYHAWVCGHVAKYVEPKLVELMKSRGYESYSSKIFMRYTVLVSDLIVFVPALIYFITFCKYKLLQDQKKNVILAYVLLHGAFVLIDHGHFQYNCVCLGLTVWAIAMIDESKILTGSVLFVMSICFKQMSLYFAPAFFFYLLRYAFHQKNAKSSLKVIFSLGTTVIITFVFCFVPFLQSKELFFQVIHRIFPLARGLFEDKVSNFWCVTNLVIKWQRSFSNASLAKLSTLLTLVSLIPNAWMTLKSKRVNSTLLLVSLSNSALSFFFFSFQVHEKTILFPLLPICLLIGVYPELVFIFSHVACFSMYPLLKKDGLAISYFVHQLTLLFVAELTKPHVCMEKRNGLNRFLNDIRWISVTGCLAIHALDFHYVEGWIPLFGRQYPDVILYLYAFYSFAHFFAAWIYLHIMQYSLTRDDKIKSS